LIIGSGVDNHVFECSGTRYIVPERTVPSLVAERVARFPSGERNSS
jgi:hypothetical protein